MDNFISSSIILFREGFEAFLIMFLVLGFIRKSGNVSMTKFVYLGAGLAVVLSIVLGFVFQAMSIEFEGMTEYLFEGITMIVTSLLLSFMILWLVRFKTNTGAIRSQVDRHAKQNYGWGIFLLVFTSVLREGVETVLFFIGLKLDGGTEVLFGAITGLIIAFVLCYGIFAGTIRLNFKMFFNITTFLLLLIVAGLMSHGVHELNEAKWIPEVIEHVWDINHILDEKSRVGSLLSGIFGYNGNPSLTEVISYVLYLLVVGGLWYGLEKRSSKTATA